MRTRICRISFGRPWRLHPMSIDTLGFEPRAIRMRGGSDTTTPRAPGKSTAVHLHRATTAGEASCFWAQQEKSGPPVVQDDKTMLAVFDKGLPLDKITALHVHWASRRSSYGASRRSVGHQSCKMTHCRRPFANKACVTATAQSVPWSKMAAVCGGSRQGSTPAF